MDLTRRGGAFSITTLGGEIFKNKDQREELRMIFAAVVIVKALHMPGMDRIDYMALSEHFDEIEPGGKVPQYIPCFSVDDKGNRGQVIFDKVEIKGAKKNETCIN